MSKKDFRIYQDGDRQIIERLSYPRFKGVVTFNSPLSDIEEIELLDKTNNPTEIAKAMREAGDFLINYKPKANE
jgi:hypothetical protein